MMSPAGFLVFRTVALRRSLFFLRKLLQGIQADVTGLATVCTVAGPFQSLQMRVTIHSKSGSIWEKFRLGSVEDKVVF